MMYADYEKTAGRPLEVTAVVFGGLRKHWRVRVRGGKEISEGIGSLVFRSSLILTYVPEDW